MIQFNLLPDVKLQYVKAKRAQDIVILVSTVLIAVFLAIFVILYVYVSIIQKNHIKNLSNQITSSTQQITSNSNLNKILTIQNQLESLPSLYNGRPATTQLLPFVNQLTPSKATISTLAVNFVQDSGSIAGNADSLATVNTFVDTLKFTTFTAGSIKGTNAFSGVVLTSFAQTTTPVGFSYSIAFSYNPEIFNESAQATLSVPNQITTRSITQQPTDLFLGTSSGNK
jgi:hypothetical protein